MREQLKMEVGFLSIFIFSLITSCFSLFYLFWDMFASQFFVLPVIFSGFMTIASIILLIAGILLMILSTRAYLHYRDSIILEQCY